MRAFIYTYRYLFAAYAGLINLYAFILFGVDKRRAKRKMWRIPEARLLLSALLGGSVGAMLGMAIFHHKTKKPKFFVLVPLIFIVESGLIAYFFLKSA